MWKSNGLFRATLFSLAVALAMPQLAGPLAASEAQAAGLPGDLEIGAEPWTQIEEGVWTRELASGKTETRTAGRAGTLYLLRQERKVLEELLAAEGTILSSGSLGAIAKQRQFISRLESGLLSAAPLPAISGPPSSGGCSFYLDATASTSCDSQSGNAEASYSGDCAGGCFVHARVINRRVRCSGSEFLTSDQCNLFGGDVSCSASHSVSFPSHDCSNRATSIIYCDDGTSLQMEQNNSECDCDEYQCVVTLPPGEWPPRIPR
ncbi:MAG: hypothetical protein K0U98_05170 [Deltaproteobacteria bacterium]|nr:hypothetical protein [Deltaproteobacteria bacterium]